MKDARRVTVMATCRTSNRNSPVLKQTLQILISRPNALNTTRDVVVCYPEFSVNCRNLAPDAVSEFFQGVFLQPDHVPSNPLLVPFVVAVVTILWPFVHTFAEHFSPELRNFLRHSPADSYIQLH